MSRKKKINCVQSRFHNMDGSRAEKRECPQEVEPVLIKIKKENSSSNDNIYITKDGFKVGRSLENDLIIKSVYISRQHCIFHNRQDDEWSITNYSSINPILVNNDLILKGHTQILRVGDIIQLNANDDFKYVFTLNSKSKRIAKRARLDSQLYDDVLNEQRTFVAVHESRRKKLENQLQEKQKEQISLKEELERLKKEEEISKEESEQIAKLKEKIEDGHVVEVQLQNKYRDLLNKLEEEKQVFERRLAEEKQKWEEALEASRQEKQALETSMKEQMEEWKIKQQEEWKNKMESLAMKEKIVQEKLLNEKSLLEQKLREMEDALKERENVLQAVSTPNIKEDTVNLLENAIVVEIPQSTSTLQTSAHIFDTIDLTRETSQSPSERATADILNRVENIMDENMTCSICSELFVRAMTTNCMHTFCNHCIMSWIKKNKEPLCPNCRTKIVSITRSLVIDNFIDKMVDNLPPSSRDRRNVLINERKELRKKSKRVLRNCRKR